MHSRELRRPMVAIGILAVTSLNYQVLVPLLATRELDGSEGHYVAILSTLSVGALFGTLVVSRRTSVTASFQGGATTAYGCAMVALAFAPTLPISLPPAFALGVGAMMLFTSSAVWVQLAARESMRGRSIGIFTWLFIGGQGVGGLVAGALADRWGTRAAMGLGGAVAIGVGAVLARTSRARFEEAVDTLGDNLVI